MFPTTGTTNCSQGKKDQGGGPLQGSEEYDILGVIMFDRVFYMPGHPEIVEQACNFDWSVLEGYEFDLRSITYGFLTGPAGMTDEEMQHLMERISG